MEDERIFRNMILEDFEKQGGNTTIWNFGKI